MKALQIIVILLTSLVIGNQINTIKMDSFDLDAILLEDKIRQPGTPERYAYTFDVDINLFDLADIEILDNGDKIWRLAIQSDNAIGLKFYFNEFYLPAGSSLMIYNQNSDMVVGPLNSENNHEDGEFSHRLLKGDNITLEYYEPTNLIEVPLINISNVYHAYKDILGFYDSDRDRNCGENVECDDGTFEDQINSVIYLEMSGYICSAALINNTSFDLTPYVLTANHCVDPEEPGEHNYFTFYFRHQSSSCSGSSGSYSYSRTGSYLRASYYYSDFALLEMDYTPATSFNAYYAGWDRSSSSPQVSVGIHHPGGDPKKINYDNNDTAYSDGWYSNNTHWRLSWDEGGTEGGSSGSPLFDNEKLIVGQLHGGTGECGNGQDFYGKVYTSWNGGGTSTTRLSNWLDPNGTGYSSITGTYDGEGGGEDPPEVTLSSPNGGESWQAGESYAIVWDDNFDENVSLKLYRGGVFASTISASTASDGAFIWAIPSDIEPRDDYRIKITNVDESAVSDFSGYFSIYSSGSISLAIDAVNLNASGGSIDIYMENDIPVAGYQFTISDSPDYIDILGVNDLTDSDFSLSSSEDGIVIAFSFTGGTISEGSGLLVSANFETIESDTITLCLQDPVFSTASSNSIPVSIGECVEVELTQVLLGDISLDGVINVLDAVLLVNAVLDPSLLNDIQFQAADLNADGSLNVLDVVSLINLIINS